MQQIQASRGAFAAILGDGSVVYWGSGEDGGDSSAVQDQLKNVQQIQASRRAFAAIRGDGSVVTWADTFFGGDSRAVQHQLRDVQQIQAFNSAFAQSWVMDLWSPGVMSTLVDDRSAVQDQLRDVQQTFSKIPCLWGRGGGWGCCKASVFRVQSLVPRSLRLCRVLEQSPDDPAASHRVW